LEHANEIFVSYIADIGSTREVCHLVHKQKAYRGKLGRSTLHDAPTWVPFAVPMKPLPHQPLIDDSSCHVVAHHQNLMNISAGAIGGT
jgi:hypothetical protein